MIRAVDFDEATVRRRVAECLAAAADRGVDLNSIKIELVPQFLITGKSTSRLGDPHDFKVLMDKDYNLLEYRDTTEAKKK